MSTVEQLEDRKLLSASPYDMVTYDVASGQETIVPYAEFGTPTEAMEGGQAGFDVPNVPRTVPDGFDFPDAGESVFGNDDRDLIFDPVTYPYTRHGSMRMLKTNGNWSFCSGAMIGPFHFLTAGHCVHEGGTGGNGWYSNVQVTLARNGDARWYGAANSTKITSVNGWTQSDSPNYDWAVITLDRNLGNAAGWNGWWWYSNDNTYTGMNVSIAGYPSDLATSWSQSTLANDTHEIEMYESTGNMTSPTSHQLRYNGTLDTFGGMSGSSVIQDKPGTGRVAVGIHAYGRGNNNTNEATRIREPMSDLISSLRNNDSSPTDRPDLVDWDRWFHSSAAFTSTSSVRPGESFSVTAYPRNNGTATAGGYRVSFYASANTTISTADHFLGSVNMGSLGRFSWDTANLNLSQFPDSVPEGSYYVGWRIDSGSAVTEFLEGNNTGYISTKLNVVKALPDTWTGNVESYAFAINDAAGDLVNDSLALDAYINFSGDADSYYFASDQSGTFTIDVGDFGNAVDPMVAVYRADTGAKLGWNDDGGPGDDARLSVNLSAWTRYIVAVADYRESNTGDVSLQIRAPNQSTGSTLTLDANGDATDSINSINVDADTDFFAFTAPANAAGNLTVDVDPAAGLDMVLVVWDQFDNVISRRDVTGAGGVEVFNTSGVTPGEQFQVSLLSDSYSSNGSYVLHVDFSTTSSLLGDFNGDGQLNCGDVDALVAEIVSGTHNAVYDMNGDTVVNTVDLDAWLAAAGAQNLASGNSYLKGDANLDGSVDTLDFNSWNSNKFTRNPSWCNGDFNADGIVDILDLNIWNSNKFSSADRAAIVWDGAHGPATLSLRDGEITDGSRQDELQDQALLAELPSVGLPRLSSSAAERSIAGGVNRAIAGRLDPAGLEFVFADLERQTHV